MCYLDDMSSKSKSKNWQMSSMTGFARSSGSMEGYSWSWEAKSVNGKGMDVRCRMPQGFEEFDSEARTAVGKMFKRGNFNMILTVNGTSSQIQYRVNRVLLDQLVKVATELQTDVEAFDKPRLDGLFSVRGVIEPIPEAEGVSEQAKYKSQLLTSLGLVLSLLAENRREEGARIGSVLYQQLTKIIVLCKQAEQTAELQPGIIRQKLVEQISDLLGSLPSLSEERLAQEVAILMTKSDIREELDRLESHIRAAKNLMEAGGVIGRQLDFLCQEFNRETNTLCSKAADVELSKIGLELKAVIEQFREQVQNIE